MTAPSFALSLLFMIVSLAAPIAAKGQETDSPQKAYMDEPVRTRSFGEAEWKKTTRGLNYTLRPRKQAPEKKRREGPGIWSVNAGPVMRLFAVASFALIAAFILRALILSPRDKKIRESRLSFTANDLEKDIPESELDLYLAEAIRSGDYALAVRIYYLQALQRLQLLSLIQWKKDKTNREYLRDLRATPYAADFDRLTQIFEKVRYGAYAPGRGEFVFLEREFKSFLQSLRAAEFTNLKPSAS